MLASRSYQITHFLDDTAVLLASHADVTGLFGKNGLIGMIGTQASPATAIFKNIQGYLFHLKEAATLTRQGGGSLVTKLEAKPAQFWDIVTADGRCFEVKVSWETLRGKTERAFVSEYEEVIRRWIEMSNIPQGKAGYILGDINGTVPPELITNLADVMPPQNWILNRAVPQ